MKRVPLSVISKDVNFMILPLTRPASEYQLTRSLTLNRCSCHLTAPPNVSSDGIVARSSFTYPRT